MRTKDLLTWSPDKELGEVNGSSHYDDNEHMFI